MATEPARASDDAPRIGPARWQVIALVVALCFLAGVVGWWIGKPADPEPYSDVDVGFLTDMSTHHNSAIAMGLDTIGRGADPGVEHFARDIVLSQTQEIAVMNAMLERAGDRTSPAADVAMAWMGEPVAPSEMPGIPTPDEQRALAAADGAELDDLFTTLMIRHHAAGAVMADYAAEHGENERVRRLAAAMAKVQRTEVNEINSRRVELGLPRIDVGDLDHAAAGTGHTH